MIMVIIAGGAGTRLWPLSTSNYPKHLLTLNGDSRTLLQRTYERAKLVTGQPEDIYVVSEASHISHVQNQLPELPEANFVIEPARRGTASCLAAALVRIKSSKHTKDEVVAFVPADHHIRDSAGFTQALKLAEQAATSHNTLTLVGVDPDYPATGFGYIQKDGPTSDVAFVYKVGSFREKPDYQQAQDYLSSGQYLWNCSYHVGRLESFETMLESSAPKLFENYERLAAAKDPATYEAIYLQFENTSIEYAFTEKTKNLLVVAGAFDWLDLGSFADMHRAVGSDENGNFTHGLVEMDEVANSFIQNNEDKPIAVIGLDNIVIVNNPNGILVMRKDRSQKVGSVSQRFQTKDKKN